MFNKKIIKELEDNNKALEDRNKELEYELMISKEVTSNLNTVIKNKDLEIDTLIKGIESIGLSHVKLIYKGDMWYNRSKVLLRSMINNAIKNSTLEDLHNSGNDFLNDYLNSLPGYDKKSFSDQLDNDNANMAFTQHSYITMGLNDFLIKN